MHLAAGAVALPAMSRWARAQSYPSRPVRLIVGYPAGAASDTLGRILGQSLAERLGQQFVIENRPGANSNLATELVARAAGDGYTLLLASNSNAINATLYDKLNKEINAALADPKIKARFADLGGTVFPTSPADFGKFIADETDKWGKVIRAANIKAE